MISSALALFRRIQPPNKRAEGTKARLETSLEQFATTGLANGETAIAKKEALYGRILAFQYLAQNVPNSDAQQSVLLADIETRVGTAYFSQELCSLMKHRSTSKIVLFFSTLVPRTLLEQMKKDMGDGDIKRARLSERVLELLPEEQRAGFQRFLGKTGFRLTPAAAAAPADGDARAATAVPVGDGAVLVRPGRHARVAPADVAHMPPPPPDHAARFGPDSLPAAANAGRRPRDQGVHFARDVGPA